MVDQSSARRLEITTCLARVRGDIADAAKQAGRKVEDIELIVVTKTFPRSDVEILYQLGLRNFGENRDQEGLLKSENFHKEAIWHFHGEVQSNKIKSIARWASVIHSLDQVSHAKKFDNAVAELGNGKILDVLIQVSLDSRNLDNRSAEMRGGVLPEKIADMGRQISTMKNLRLAGVMALAPLGEVPKSAFSRLAVIHTDFLKEFPDSRWLSAGMSGDFQEGIAIGATHLRIGSSILGVR